MNQEISDQSCINPNCKVYGLSVFDLLTLHDKKRGRLRCKVCGKTWSFRRDKLFYRLHSDDVQVRRAIKMLEAGLPIRKIARLVDVNAGTVMRWKKKFL
jgi:transposase-like protein